MMNHTPSGNAPFLKESEPQDVTTNSPTARSLSADTISSLQSSIRFAWKEIAALRDMNEVLARQSWELEQRIDRLERGL